MDILKYFRKKPITIGQIYGPGIKKQMDHVDSTFEYNKLTTEALHKLMKDLLIQKYEQKGDR